MSEQIEGCPQPETPIRERAWTDGQRLARVRELAEMWKAGDFEERECAEKLLAILDAGRPRDGMENLMHWYALSKTTGMATLCASEQDARREAKAYDNIYPQAAPHIATQLVPVGAQELIEACVPGGSICDPQGVADALKDAERYRWLRKEHKSDGPSYHVRRPSNCPAPRDLDADLDAAMKGANDPI